MPLTSITDLENAHCYPVPFKPSTHNSLTFTLLTNTAKIRIYDIAGEKVAELDETDGDNKYVWTEAKSMASGVYFYLITHDKGQKKLNKLVIIR